jgi:steroid 5-alpha reductase family enzyme
MTIALLRYFVIQIIIAFIIARPVYRGRKRGQNQAIKRGTIIAR